MSAIVQNSIRLIRNATLRMSYAGKEILVDPMLGEKGKGFYVMKENNNPRVNLVMSGTEAHSRYFGEAGCIPWDTLAEFFNKNLK